MMFYVCLGKIPKEVIERSNEILLQLEEQRGDMDVSQTMKTVSQNKMQLSMFSLDDPLMIRINEELRKIDVNTSVVSDLTSPAPAFSFNKVV
jgi:DNA mismatch repair protein MutS